MSLHFYMRSKSCLFFYSVLSFVSIFSSRLSFSINLSHFWGGWDNRNDYIAFSLTWPASMLIYWNKRKFLHNKRVQFPQGCLGTPTWPIPANSHACGLKTSISRRLTLTGQFLKPDWKMWVVAVLLDTISKNMLTQTHVRNENHV